MIRRSPMLLTWKISLAESLAFAATAVTLTLWVMATFVEKSSAKEFSDQVESRFMQMESGRQRLDDKIDKIEDDVAVIRGILEGQKRREKRGKNQGD